MPSIWMPNSTKTFYNTHVVSCKKSLCNCFFEEKNFKSKNLLRNHLDALRWCCTSPPASKRSFQMFLDMYQNQQKGRGITVYHLLLRFSPNWFFRLSRQIQITQQPDRPTLLFSIDINPKKHVSKPQDNRHASWTIVWKWLFSRLHLVVLFRRLVKRQSTSDWIK